MKSVMVSIRRHQGPMYAVLKRAGIGIVDKYGRGIWIKETDLSKIREYFESHGYSYTVNDWWTFGTNQHNTVFYHNFVELFK